MSRPTEELKKTVKVRVTEEQYESLVEESEEREISLSDVIRERISFVPQNSEGFVPQNSFVPQKKGFVPQNSERIDRISKELGVEEEKLLEIVEYLITSKKLYRENENIRIKGLNADPEYISVDEAIDNVDAPEWKKKAYKEMIIKNLDVNRYDDTGNGGGL